jgi:AcrR family transcriptional regulator
MPKNVDHGEHRKRLLEKCFELFCREGYSNVTMRGIARELKLSTGALYHYFPTKLGILEQMFSWALENDIGSYIEGQGNVPPGERAGEIVAFWYGRKEYYLNLMLLAMDLYRNSPGRAREVLARFADTYKSGISQSLGANRRLSEVAFNYLLGCVVHYLLAPDQFSTDKEVEFVRDALGLLLVPEKGSGGIDVKAAGRLLGSLAEAQDTGRKKAARKTGVK